MKIILITGGVGFIVSALSKHVNTHTHHKVLNIDKKTNSEMQKATAQIENNANH